AGVPLVARALPVLADPHLLAEHVVDDARRHRRRGREVGLAVAADEQDARLEGLPGLRLDAVHEEPLALLDAVLLAADGDDRVAHDKGNARISGGPSVANAGITRFRRPTATWARSPNPPPPTPARARAGAGARVAAPRRRSPRPLPWRPRASGGSCRRASR